MDEHKKKNKLLILSFHPTYYKVPIYRMLHNEDGLEVKVVFFSNLGANKKYYSSGFGKEVDMELDVLSGYDYKFLKNFSLRPLNSFFGQINLGIVPELIKGKYDYIWIDGWDSFTNMIAVIFAKTLGTKILLRSENPLNQEVKKSFWKKLFKKVVLGKIFFKLIDDFLYIGDQNKRFYDYYGVPEKKMFFMPYAVDNSRLMAANRELGIKRQELRNELGIGENDIVILFVGKLISKKRPMDLLKAFELVVKGQGSRVKGSQKRAMLFFVGDGELRPELEKYAREHNLYSANSDTFVNSGYGVRFTGFQNQTELLKYYVVADIFVFPSGVGETWGLVLNEAMNFGLPAVVSDIPGSGFDLVKDGENGFVFPDGEINYLESCLKKLAEDKILRKKFGDRSLEIVKHYSYDKDVEGILSALDPNIFG